MSVESVPAPTTFAESPAKSEETSSSRGLFPALLVTTASVHLLLAGVLGFGLGDDPPARVASAEKPIAPTTIESIELEPAPTDEIEQLPPEEPAILEELPPELSAPVVADLALPPLPELAPIAAVAPTVPVAFAIPVTGPVRVTDDPARATGSLGGVSGPVSLDADGNLARNLILPRLEYPLTALQRRISGSVDIEFRVASTGGRISDARVRRSSGFTELDSAAILNLRRGRWLGSPGYYVKTFVFTLN